jgi:plastocyanin
MRLRALVLGAALSVATVPAGAEVKPVVVTLPGAWVTTYATQVVVVDAARAADYVNADIALHDVWSVATRPAGDASPWCAKFASAKCPVFYSELIPLAEITPILGLEDVVAGQFYEFYCSIHRGMRGTLVAIE